MLKLAILQWRMAAFLLCLAFYRVVLAYDVVVEEERSRFIIQLKQDPIIVNESTRLQQQHGRKLLKTDAAVQDYVYNLETQHDAIMSSIGGVKLYSYTYAFNGFAAMLTSDEVDILQTHESVLHIFEDEIREQELTSSASSPNEVSDNKDESDDDDELDILWKLGYTGEDIVIGVIDGGINPEHPSFADVPTPRGGNTGELVPYTPLEGWSNAPCAFGNTEKNHENDVPFNCTNKIVSAKCFAMEFSNFVNSSYMCGGDGAGLVSDEFLSARDSHDHGSHVASTAAGNYHFVDLYNTSISGSAPRARLAIYKVCWVGIGRRACGLVDLAAAIDEAVADGVDVINYSLGGSGTSFGNVDDIAFLNAVKAGIWVVTSNGNGGPRPGSVGSPAGVPWITAVGAVTDDKGTGIQVLTPIQESFGAKQANSPVQLGPLEAIEASLELPYPDVCACNPIEPLSHSESSIALVIRGGCTFTKKFQMVAAAGAEMIVVYNNGTNANYMEPTVMTADDTTIPGYMISYNAGLQIANLLKNQTRVVTAKVGHVHQGTQVASFSSKGPNRGALDIIKPDVVAPGVDILGAGTPFDAGGIDDESIYLKLSGSSMASPYVAGMFAILKQVHPNWTPAEAKSAIMTSASLHQIKKYFGDDAADPFDIGSGHVSADLLNPGLVYNTKFEDYQAFSCGNEDWIVSEERCNELKQLGYSLDGSDLNYPSIAISDLTLPQLVNRTVTYKGEGVEEEFVVSVESPPGIKVQVTPSQLKLKTDESATYQVLFSITTNVTTPDWRFGSITWSSPKKGPKTTKERSYIVRSPIAIKMGLILP